MKRYNQGFFKFGPMEQCDNGEWIKYEGHEKVVKDFLKAYDKMSEKLYTALEQNTSMRLGLETARVEIARSMWVIAVLAATTIYLGAKVAGLL